MKTSSTSIVTRWQMDLSQFDCTFIHVPGDKNLLTDSMSHVDLDAKKIDSSQENSYNSSSRVFQNIKAQEHLESFDFSSNYENFVPMQNQLQENEMSHKNIKLKDSKVIKYSNVNLCIGILCH